MSGALQEFDCCTPLVTIGVPTYKRPDLLRRALISVANQDYPNIELIVADNGTPGSAVMDVVESFRPRIANLTFKKHAENIGAFKNFFSLLDAAHGKYFMWLADDDEISSNFVSSLVALLESDLTASSAAGHWVWMDRETSIRNMPTASFPQRSALVRALRFIWRTDDAFFYGLHRTSVMRRATFPGYCWPNRGVLFNWAYVYLLDMVLSGPILLPSDPSVRFINHDYTPKQYARGGGRLKPILMYVARRMNVHFLYLCKVFRSLSIWAAILALFVALAALTREIAVYLFDVARTGLRQFWVRRIHGSSG